MWWGKVSVVGAKGGRNGAVGQSTRGTAGKVLGRCGLVLKGEQETVAGSKMV